MSEFTIIRKIPAVTTSQLEAIGSLQYGFSAHCGIIVVWDSDYDERVLRMIEERFPAGSKKPLAVCESEGTISILWADEMDAMFAAPADYTTEGDYWTPSHYYCAFGAVNELP